jgi:hypothetical protein
LFIINMVVVMLGYAYYPDNGNKVPASLEGVIKASAAVRFSPYF